MDATKVRTAFSTIQSNPWDHEGWSILASELRSKEGDLSGSAAEELLRTARGKHAARGEFSAVQKLFELSTEIRGDDSQAIPLYLEQAKVALNHLFDGTLALSLLTHASNVAGPDAEVSSIADKLRDEASAWQEKAATYLEEASAATDDAYRSAMLMRASEVEFRFSEQPRFELLIENLEQSLRLDQTNLTASLLLEAIYERTNNTGGLIEVLTRSADRSSDIQARAMAGVRLARLYLHKEGDSAKAVATYDQVLNADAHQRDAVEFLTDLYAEDERWDELVSVYERRLLSAKELAPEQRLGDMLQVAMLHWKKREQATDAEPWFSKIQELSPAHETMLSFFREFKTSMGDEAGLVDVLEKAQEALPSESPLIGQIKEELSDLNIAQTDAHRSIETYKAILRDDDSSDEAREELKKLYKQTRGHNALIELLQQQLKRTSEDEYERRLALYREMAEVHRRYMKSDTGLVNVLNQIVNLDGKLDEQDIDEVRELVGLYDKLGRHRDLLATQKLLAEIVPETKEKISLYRQVGRRWLEQFSNVQHAIQAFAALYELAPKDKEAIERLEELYRKRRAWKELFSLYENQLVALEGKARVPLLKEMAQLAAERLSRVPDALNYYQEILTIDDSRLDVIERMEKHAERSKSWPILAEVLEKRLSQMPADDTSLPVLQKLGGIYSEQLNDPEEAIRTWQRVVAVQPGHSRAMRVLRDTFLRAERFDDLEELYLSQDEIEGLAEVLSTAADRNKVPEQKLELSYRAASVYEERLKQAPRAIRSYERILTIKKGDPRAIQRLLPLYEQEEKWARVPALLETLIEATSEAAEKVALYQRLVEVSEKRLSDRRGAIRYARAAYELAPELPETLELLESMSRSTGAWDEMVLALEGRLTALGEAGQESQFFKSNLPTTEDVHAEESDADEEVIEANADAEGELPVDTQEENSEQPVYSAAGRTIALRLARVLGEELSRPDEAIVRLKALILADSHDEEVRDALERVLRLEDRPEELRWLYDQRQKNAHSAEDRGEILCEWAGFEEEQMADLAEALRLYQLALTDTDTAIDALEAVARLALVLKQPQVAVDVVVRHVDLLSGTEQALKEAYLAGLYINELNQAEEALLTAESALEHGAEPGAVIGVLSQLIEIAEVRAEAARLLSELYEAGGDSRKEADAINALISETEVGPEQLALYQKLISVFEEKLNEPGSALSVGLEALKNYETEISLWDRAQQLSELAQMPNELAQGYRAALDKELDLELSLELSRRAAELYQKRLEDPGGAVPYLRKVLSLAPDDQQAFGSLKQILTASERWRDLEALYDQEVVRLDDDSLKIEMLAEVALLAEDIMGEPKRAVGYHQRIIEIDEIYPVALESLDRLYTRLEQKEPLLDLLEQRAELAIAEEQTQLLVRVAQLALELNQAERAILPIESVLEENLGHHEAREVCEKLLQLPKVRGRAAQALEKVYEEKDEVRDLVRVLEVRVDVLRPKQDEEESQEVVDEQANERRELLRRIATLRDDRLHDDEGSFDTFAELAPLDSADAELRERLVDSGRRLGRSQKVVEVLLLCAEHADSAQLKSEVLMQTGAIQCELLEDDVAAEATYRKVIELSDEEPEVALEAARLVEQLLLSSERPKELVAILRIQIDLEQDFEIKHELLARVAQISSDLLGDDDAAMQAWEARLIDEPDDADSLQQLTILYEKVERFTDLAKVLLQRRDNESDQEQRARLARHLAEVQERNLNQPELAIDSYQELLDENGPDPIVLSALVRLYRAAARWEELADALEREGEVLEDDLKRLDTLAALGQVRIEHLEDLPGAMEAYRSALAFNSQHEACRAALTLLLSHDDQIARMEAADLLEPLYEAEGNYRKLLNVVEVQAASSDDPTFKASRFERALQLAEQELAELPKALGIAVEGIKQAAQSGEIENWLSALERLAVATENRQLQVDTLAEVVSEIFDTDLQLTVQKRVAELLLSELGRLPEAVDAYLKALEIMPEDSEALEALDGLYVSLERWDELLEVLERRQTLAEIDADVKTFISRRAEIFDVQKNDLPLAIQSYEALIDISLDEQSVDHLRGLYRKTERFEDLTSLLQRLIDDEFGDRVALRVALARVFFDHLSEAERGLDELEQALGEDSQNDGAVALLEELRASQEEPEVKGRIAGLLEPVYMALADYDKVLSILELRREVSDSPDDRRDLATRIAQIFEEQKEDYHSALNVIATLVEDDPHDEVSLNEMERLTAVGGLELRLAELLSKIAAHYQDADDEASARLCRRAGTLFSQHEKPAAALPLLQRALAFEPESAELFDAVDQLMIAVGTAEARAELYQAGLEHRYDPDEQARMQHVLAFIQEKQLGNQAGAIDAHRAALEADPENVESLDALSRLYRERESWSELAELLEQRASQLPPYDAASYRLELAELLEVSLERDEDALSQLEEIVSEVVDHAEAIAKIESFRDSPHLRARVVEILKPLYEASDDWKRLIRLNEDRFALAEDELEQVAVLQDTAALWENRGDNSERAGRALGEALKLEPENEELRQDVERLTMITETWSEMVELYEIILETHEELANQSEYIERLAVLCNEKLERPRDSLTRYKQLLPFDANNVEVLSAISYLATLLGDWLSLESALEAQAEASYEDEERVSLWSRLGELRLRTLENRVGAVSAFESAFETDERNISVCESLIRLFEEEGAPERLSDIYSARLDVGDLFGEERYELLCKLATLLETQLKDLGRAIETFQLALDALPGDPATLSNLNRLYRVEEMWSELLDNLRLEASSIEDEARRLELRREIAETLYLKLESFEEALEAYRTILEELPADDAASEAVFSLAKQEEHLQDRAAEILIEALKRTDKRERLIAALRLGLGAEQDPAARVETLLMVAQIQEVDLKSPQAAFESLTEALQEPLDAMPLLENLTRLAEEADAWESFVEALVTKAGETYEPELARALWVKIAGIRQERLSDKEGAVAAYESATEQVGDQLELLEALDLLLTELGRTDDVIALLDRRRALADSDEAQARLFTRQGQIQLETQEAPQEALASFQQALQLDLNNADASQYIQSLLKNEALFEEAFECLDSTFRGRSDATSLAELHRLRVEGAKSPEQRLEMQRELAQVLEEECGDALAAQRCYQEVLAENLEDASLLDELERVLAITDAWGEAADALLAAIKASQTTGQAVVELCMRAGEWQRDRAQSLELSEKAFLQAAELAETSGELVLLDQALEQLEVFQNVEGREDDLLVTLRSRAENSEEVGVKIDFYRRAYELAVTLNAFDLGEELLRSVIAEEPEEEWALLALLTLREKAEDFEEVFALCQQLAELLGDPEQGRDLQLRAADLALGVLEKPEEGITLIETLFESQPYDLIVSGALRRAYERRGDFDQLSVLLEKLSETATEAAAILDLKVARAKLELAHLPDKRSSALAALEEVYAEDSRNQEVVDVLLREYQADENYLAAVAILKTQAEEALVQEDTEKALVQLRQKASLELEKLSQPQASIATWVEIRALDDSESVRETLLDQQLSFEDFFSAAALLEEICAGLSPETLKPRVMELVEIYRKLNDSDQVIATLEKVLALDRFDSEVREILRNDYLAAENFQAVAELFLEDAKNEADVAQQVNLLRQSAALFASKVVDTARAAEVLQEASLLLPDDRELLLDLCDAYSASARGAEAAATLEKLIESYGGKRDKALAPIYSRFANAQLSLGEKEKATEALDKAMSMDSSNSSYRKQAAELAFEQSQFEAAQKHFKALLMQKFTPDGPITKAMVFCRLGQIQQALAQPTKAKQYFERALKEDANLAPAQAGLASL